MQFVIRYTPELKAAYLHIGGDHRVVARTDSPGDDDSVMIDLDEDGQVIGIELLGVDEPVVHVMAEE